MLRSLIQLVLGVGLLVGAAHAASDIQFTMNANFAFQYTFQGGSSGDILASANTNPTLNLIVGKRYRITNQATAGHPFSLIAKGTDSTLDVLLLAEGTFFNGSFESNSGVNWIDDNAGNLEFTLTPALATAMVQGGNVPGYRCNNHPSLMRGNFNLFNNGTPIADPLPNIAKGSITVEVQNVVTSLTAPLGAVFPNDASGRMFIYEQNGVVRVLQNGALLPTPALDLSSRITPLGVFGAGSYDERGLLGLALHPNFNSNHKLYTHTSEPLGPSADFTVALPNGAVFSHQEVITEWTMSTTDTNQVNAATRRVLMRIDKPQFNHNGGTIAFGPDGLLYIGLGDGGGADDADGESYLNNTVTSGHGPDGNGQNIDVALGKILRIDVNGSNSANGQYGIPAGNPFAGGGGVKEIFAVGVRNPYAFSFDTATGKLYIGDVGQNNVEEVDILTSASAGANLGWRLKEGTFYFDNNSSLSGRVVTVPVKPLPAGLTDPVAQYDHNDGLAVVAGRVYRGSALPDLAGKFIFGDLGTFAAPAGRLFYMDANGGTIQELRLGANDHPLNFWVKGFAQDLQGEVYVCVSGNLAPFGQSGRVLKIVPLAAINEAHEWTIYR